MLALISLYFRFPSNQVGHQLPNRQSTSPCHPSEPLLLPPRPLLSLADDLRLRGLTDGAGGNNGQEHVPEKIPLQSFAQKEQPSESQLDLPNPYNIFNQENEKETSSKLPVALFSVEAHQLDEEIRSMMEVSKNMVQIGNFTRRAKICKVCGKEGHGTDIKRHIEANHITSQISHSCDICG